MNTQHTHSRIISVVTTLAVSIAVVVFGVFVHARLVDAQATPYDVRFVKALPGMTGRNSAFGATDGLEYAFSTGEYFIIGGKSQNLGGNAGGLYVFTPDGRKVGERNIAADSGNGVTFAHSWQVFTPPSVHRDGRHFLIPTRGGLGRSALYYEITNSGVNLLSRTFKQSSRRLGVSGGAIVGNRAIVDVDQDDALDASGNTIPGGPFRVTYSLPDLQEVQRVSRSHHITDVISAAVDDLVIVGRGLVYRFENDTLQEIGPIPPEIVPGGHFQAFPTENKIVFLENARPGTPPGTYNALVYEAGTDGLRLVRTIPDLELGGNPSVTGFGFSGEYLVTRTGGVFGGGGSVVVHKGTEKLSVEPLPPRTNPKEIENCKQGARLEGGSDEHCDNLPSDAWGVAILGRNIVVTTNDAAYLYEIVNFSPSSPTRSGDGTPERLHVSLTQQNPVFTHKDIPGGFTGRTGSTPFTDSLALPTGQFVMSGLCSGSGSGALSSGVFEGGGQYLFDSNGTFVDKQDVCFDTSTRAVGCVEAKGCFAGTSMFPLGSGRFLRDLDPSFTSGPGFPRSPIVYDANASGFDLVKKLFFTTIGSPISSLAEGDVRSFERAVVAGGMMVGVSERFESGRLQEHTEVYSLPEMQLITQIDTSNRPALYPVTGIGKFLLARERSGGRSEVKVYKMPTRAELATGVRPEPVQSFDKGNPIAWAFDPSKPDRIALAFWPGSGTGAVVIYEAGEERLNVVAEYPTLIQGFGVGPLGSGRFAVLDDYVVYWKGNDLVVEKGGSPLTVDPLPQDDFVIHTVAVSPQGRILVAGYDFSNQDDNGSIYVYQIDDLVSSGGISPGGGPPTSLSGVDASGLEPLFSIAQQYIDEIMRILNVRPQTPQSIGSPSSSGDDAVRSPHVIHRGAQSQPARRSGGFGSVESQVESIQSRIQLLRNQLGL